MLRVIINADDLGKSSTVNRAIAEAFNAGAISSSTILANSSTLDEVIEIVKKNPCASFGVHLNLTEGVSLTKHPLFFQNGIIDIDGCYTKKVRVVKNWSKELLEAVFDEWDLQVQTVKDILPSPISHFDGHHHIHNYFPFTEILNNLCDKHQIRKIRNRYTLPTSGIKRLTESFCNYLSRLSFVSQIATDATTNKHRLMQYFKASIENHSWHNKTSGLIMSQYFTSYATGIQQANLLMKNNDSIVELMCHPGHQVYAEETKQVFLKEFQRLTKCELISYQDL